MKRSTCLPVLGIGLLIGALACAPRDQATEPDDAAGAVAAEPDAGTAVVEDASGASGAESQARARAELTGAPDSGVSGSVEVLDAPGGARVTVHVMGVKPAGPHGIHIHEAGSCAPPDFKSAGDHFNPNGAPHACPPTSPRHAGDLGSVEIGAGGDGHLELTTDLLTVAEGATSVVGRAIVLHDGADDCMTQPSGDSGDRLACGVFERVNE